MAQFVDDVCFLSLDFLNRYIKLRSFSTDGN